MRKKYPLLKRFLIWRLRHIKDRQFILILSVIIGVLGGLSAVVIKNAVHFIKELLTSGFAEEYQNYLYFVYPAVGVLIAVIYIHFIVRKHVGHGIPSVLFAISKSNGIIKRHNILSSIVTSTFTVGFGGSVGLEGPTVATGAAIGSNLGQMLHLNYRQITTLLALASAAAMAAIFKSPVAAVVFAIEVIMIDLTAASIVPLLIASVSAVLTSYFFLGQAVLYPFEIQEGFKIAESPSYILLGILTGFVSIYFTKMYIFIEERFARIKSFWSRWFVGGLILGVLIFLFPALYGEGYEAVNQTLNGDVGPLFNNSPFYSFKDNIWLIFLLFILIIFFKVVATSVTFGAGGIGGIFAPTLFIGTFAGLFFAKLFNFFEIVPVVESNFALVGMGGMIAGVLHAPLTGIFLIAEITSGYELFVPLMITSTISYATTKIFIGNSVYTHQLAKRGELLTHHKDKVVLSRMSLEKLIERNFKTIRPDAKLRDLVNVVAESSRNIFPVVDEDNNFKGIIRLDDIRNIMFKPELYDKTSVDSLMITPEYIVKFDEPMENVVNKFQESGKFNLAVVKDGKYMGFVSRAKVFSRYRSLLKQFSED
ncbi:MAG: chloride channel protein [Bacteroidales bacterium]|nr:chloride channel protein [Bacteroidales bacterium]MCF8388026.1 chloride channel protein [Bacteroidales bacterium]MCF8398289.1 chloride channel protein [Bacteroidales bacterium]